MPPRSRACPASKRWCRLATPAWPSWRTRGGTPRLRARCAADRLGRRPECQGLERVDRRDFLKVGLDAEQAFVGNQNGDAKAAIAGAAKRVEAVYAYPYQNHATMGPMNATARFHGGQVRGLGPDAGRRSIVRGGAGWLHPVCRPRNAKCTRSTSAAGSAGAVHSRTTCIRRSTSPSRCRAHR